MTTIYSYSLRRLKLLENWEMLPVFPPSTRFLGRMTSMRALEPPPFCTRFRIGWLKVWRSKRWKMEIFEFDWARPCRSSEMINEKGTNMNKQVVTPAKAGVQVLSNLLRKKLKAWI